MAILKLTGTTRNKESMGHYTNMRYNQKHDPSQLQSPNSFPQFCSPSVSLSPITSLITKFYCNLIQM